MRQATPGSDLWSKGRFDWRLRRAPHDTFRGDDDSCEHVAGDTPWSTLLMGGDRIEPDETEAEL
jgi:hypothetical protein